MPPPLRYLLPAPVSVAMLPCLTYTQPPLNVTAVTSNPQAVKQGDTFTVEVQLGFPAGSAGNLTVVSQPPGLNCAVATYLPDADGVNTTCTVGSTAVVGSYTLNATVRNDAGETATGAGSVQVVPVGVLEATAAVCVKETCVMPTLTGSLWSCLVGAGPLNSVLRLVVVPAPKLHAKILRTCWCPRICHSRHTTPESIQRLGHHCLSLSRNYPYLQPWV